MVEKLGAIWTSQPDMRLGQLVENLRNNNGAGVPELYFVEDDVIERKLDAALAGGISAAWVTR